VLVEEADPLGMNLSRFGLAAVLRARGHTSPCVDRARRGLAPRLRRPGLCSPQNVAAPFGSEAPPPPPGLALPDSEPAIAAGSVRGRQVESPVLGTLGPLAPACVRVLERCPARRI